MTRYIKALRLLCLLLPVGVLLSASLSLAQTSPPASISSVFFETASLRLPDSETQISLRRFSMNLPSLDAKLFDAPSQSKLFVAPSFRQLVSEFATTSSRQLAQPTAFQAPVKNWMSFPAVNLNPTADPTDDIDFYGHHIPLAGPLILRVAREADSHPRLTRIFKYIQPDF